MVLLIDNYDSFSYNLYQLIGSINPDIKVVRNDEVTTSEIWTLNPSHIIISPGPGKPSDAGICVDVIREFHRVYPIFGVCLGHQAIYEAFGGTVSHASRIIHGKASEIELDTGCPLFAGMPKTMTAARYHSLAGAENSLPAELRITARCSEDGEIMAVSHAEYPAYGVQFHPESVLTPKGKSIVVNFLNTKNQA